LGDRAGAAVLRLAHAHFGPLPGWHLLRAALALGLAEDGVAGWAAALDPLLAPAGLLSPAIAPGPGPAFDRLVSHPGAAPAGGAGEDAPLVSVVLPAHNAAATIDTALAGLAAQSWTRFEVLVVENGSTDDTAARVAARARRDPRFRLVAGVAGAGAYAARNLGVAQAAGGIIALHDADDWSHPDRLARQVRALLAAPAAAACLSHWVRVTPDLCPALWRPDVRPVHANLSSLMLRREVLERIGPWDRVRAGADTEFVARLRHVHGPGAVAAVLPDVPLAFGRVGPGSLTQGQTTGLTGPGAAARTAYLAAAADWHRSTTLPRMPGSGVARPFPVPDALRITLPEETA
ncbi:MAG: glycosyltransferase family 2 protein, partial [Pseudorhodobacter sp.]